TLIAVFMINSSVGGKIKEREVAIENAKKEIAKVGSPKSEKTIEEAADKMKQVTNKKGDLWKENWDRQKAMYVWPNSRLLKDVEKMNLKFGAKIPDTDFTYDEFKKPEVYLAEFSTAAVKENLRSKIPPGALGMAEMIAPTQFNGGWERILRHVTEK